VLAIYNRSHGSQADIFDLADPSVLPVLVHIRFGSSRSRLCSLSPDVDLTGFCDHLLQMLGVSKAHDIANHKRGIPWLGCLSENQLPFHYHALL